MGGEGARLTYVEGSFPFSKVQTKVALVGRQGEVQREEELEEGEEIGYELDEGGSGSLEGFQRPTPAPLRSGIWTDVWALGNC